MELHPEYAAFLPPWAPRLLSCHDTVYRKECPEDGHTTITGQCCRVPVCSYEQHRESVRWKARASALMRCLKDGMRGHELKKSLSAALSANEAVRVKPSGVYRWKLVTIGLRDTGHLPTDIRRVLGGPGLGRGLRNKFARYLAEQEGAIAAYGALDVGAEHAHVHVHFLVYAPFLPRPRLQHWLQSQDCDKKGCEHVAGDRECRGSWDVDVRAAYSPDEALKYTITPKGPGDVELHAELRLAIGICTYKRHRIETYGLAKPGALAKVDVAEARALAEYDGRLCPLCGGPMERRAIGHRVNGHYIWADIPPLE